MVTPPLEDADCVRVNEADLVREALTVIDEDIDCVGAVTVIHRVRVSVDSRVHVTFLGTRSDDTLIEATRVNVSR